MVFYCLFPIHFNRTSDYIPFLYTERKTAFFQRFIIFIVVMGKMQVVNLRIS